MNSQSLETISESEPGQLPAVISTTEAEQSVTSAEADHLLEVVRNQAKRRATFKGIVSWTGWSAVATLCVALFVYVASWKTDRLVSFDVWRWHMLDVSSNPPGSSNLQISFGGVWIFLMAFLAATHIAARVATKRQSRSSRALAAFDDLRSTGLLAEALKLPEKATQEIAAEALKPLLPRLKPSDSSLLSKIQRKALAGALSVKDRELTLRILGTFERIGAVDQLEAVQQFAKYAQGDPAVTEAARKCAEALRRHGKESKERERLLRPSQGVAGEANLLRPAGAAEHTESVLLRASEAE
jgi:hypothetical protein